MISFQPGPQPGRRPGAPGWLGLVQAFLNSHFDLDRPASRGADRLASPAELAAWLGERGLRAASAPLPRAQEHARALALRAALRTALADPAGAGPDALAAAVGGLGATWAPDGAGGLRPVPAGAGVADALGLVVALVAEAQATGTWRRLKVCPGPHCGWAFYDRSRNNAGAWCSMVVCGDRAKARAYRQRDREGPRPA